MWIVQKYVIAKTFLPHIPVFSNLSNRKKRADNIEITGIYRYFCCQRVFHKLYIREGKKETFLRKFLSFYGCGNLISYILSTGYKSLS